MRCAKHAVVELLENLYDINVIVEKTAVVLSSNSMKSQNLCRSVAVYP
jgi:hypothetical protein